jgi:hypothetical protein
MKQNYIPHAFRSLAPKKTVKLPQRRVLNHDEEMLEYHRETLLLFADMAINTVYHHNGNKHRFPPSLWNNTKSEGNADGRMLPRGWRQNIHCLRLKS